MYLALLFASIPVAVLRDCAPLVFEMLKASFTDRRVAWPDIADRLEDAHMRVVAGALAGLLASFMCAVRVVGDISSIVPLGAPALTAGTDQQRVKHIIAVAIVTSACSVAALALCRAALHRAVENAQLGLGVSRQDGASVGSVPRLSRAWDVHTQLFMCATAFCLVQPLYEKGLVLLAASAS